MDEVAFDFMDELAPGCAAMFPSEGSVSSLDRASLPIVSPPNVTQTAP